MKKAIKATAILIVFTFIFTYTPQTQPVIASNDVPKAVQLGGEPFGIKMFSEGVLVVEVEETLYGSDIPSPAKLAGIEKNDIIKAVNGITLNTNEQLSETVNSFGKNVIYLKILRGENLINTEITPQYDSQGNLRLGMWVKDSAAGIGTITYYDVDNGTFGALGHGICESETGMIIPISYGEISKATISSVRKSENGNVGSLNGYFQGETIGIANNNTECGIFGKILTETDCELIEVADKSEVYVGDAQVYCTTEGTEKKAYDVKIKRLRTNFEDTMLIEITDPQLLEITGGIAQGMSGSPIVQNGKLVGAVTHVLINNVNCGYGIFIEDMLYFSS